MRLKIIRDANRILKKIWTLSNARQEVATTSTILKACQSKSAASWRFMIINSSLVIWWCWIVLYPRASRTLRRRISMERQISNISSLTRPSWGWPKTKRPVSVSSMDLKSTVRAPMSIFTSLREISSCLMEQWFLLTQIKSYSEAAAWGIPSGSSVSVSTLVTRLRLWRMARMQSLRHQRLPNPPTTTFWLLCCSSCAWVSSLLWPPPSGPTTRARSTGICIQVILIKSRRWPSKSFSRQESGSSPWWTLFPFLSSLPLKWSTSSKPTSFQWTLKSLISTLVCRLQSNPQIWTKN